MYLFLSDYHLPQERRLLSISDTGMKIWSILLIFYLNVNVDSYGLRIRLKIFFPA